MSTVIVINNNIVINYQNTCAVTIPSSSCSAMNKVNTFHNVAKVCELN